MTIKVLHNDDDVNRLGEVMVLVVVLVMMIVMLVMVTITVTVRSITFMPFSTS